MSSTPAEKAAAAVDRMARQHAAALEALAVAQASYASALAVIADDDAADLPKLARARAQLTAAEADERIARDALDAMQARQRAALAAEAAAIVDAAWADSLAKSKAREAKAARVQAALRELSQAFGELRAASHDVHRALPAGYPSHAAAGFGLEVDLATNLVRIEYSRHGLPGGPHLMGLLPQQLDERYRDATATLERARAQSRQASETTAEGAARV